MLTIHEINQIQAEYHDEFESCLYEDDFSLIEIVLKALARYNIVPGNGFYSHAISARFILLAEAVNLAAKVFHPAFYQIKPHLIAAAAYNGCLCWEEADENGYPVYHLYHRDVGTACFHDPNAECFDLGIENAPRFNSRRFRWSGIYRQDQAFDLLKDECALAAMAMATRPRNL